MGLTPSIAEIPDAVRPVVDAVREGLAAALGDELVALYLMGSSVSGGFDAGVSDLDLIAVTAVTANRLDLAAVDAVNRAVLERFAGWDDRLEIVFVGRTTLAEFRTTDDRLAVISPGEPLHLTGPASDWLQNWFLVRATGVALVGPPPRSLVPAIAGDEFVDGVRAYLRYLGAIDVDAGPGALAYAVLSASRAARTIETGEPCSKQDAAAWMRARRPDVADLIDDALATRLVRGRRGFDDRSRRERAVALVREIAASHAAVAPAGSDPGPVSDPG